MLEAKIGNQIIHIGDRVLDLLNTYKQIKISQHESGGIILGQVKGEHVYILKISIPSYPDESTRTSFYRDKTKAQAIIDHEFANSGGKTIYLGEWHTHPEPIPKPSGTDRRMIKDQFDKNKINEPFLLLLIKGQKAIFLGKIEGTKIQSIIINE